MPVLRLVVDNVNTEVDSVNMTAVEVDTKQRLIACAIDLLDEHGVAGLGLREVARRAGVSHNAPSRHFPGGYRDLCTAVAAVGFRGFADALVEATEAAGDSPIDRFAANGRAYIGYGVANRGVFELMWRSDLIDFTDPDLIAAAAPAYASLRRCVAALQATGWHADADTEVLAATCWSWAQGVTQLWSQGAFPGPIGSKTLDDLIRTGLAVLGLEKETP